MITVGVRFGLVDGSNAHREPGGALRGVGWRTAWQTVFNRYCPLVGFGGVY